MKVISFPLLAAGRSSLAVLASCLIFSLGFPASQAAGRGQLDSSISVVPTVSGISLNDAGQLVASGQVTADIRGRTNTVPFTDVPVDISLADDQTAAGACPILDLRLAPINLNLLGLVVETSPICLKITAYDGGGLLGDLLCSVAGLLNGGVSLGDIVNGVGIPTGGVSVGALTTDQVGLLLAGVQDLLNGALGQLTNAVAGSVQDLPGGGPDCAILNLALGPVDLTLLGLNVHLDDCADGPVTVDITAVRGQLLGNLLCGLLHGGGLGIGSTLGDLINGLLGILNG